VVDPAPFRFERFEHGGSHAGGVTRAAFAAQPWFVTLSALQKDGTGVKIKLDRNFPKFKTYEEIGAIRGWSYT